jgi:ABC-type multidrug transport system ATPase subunit
MIAAGVHTPAFYCLDEAAANLDEQGWHQLSTWLDLLRSQQTTIFLASNDPRELDWCDRILSLDE